MNDDLIELFNIDESDPLYKFLLFTKKEQEDLLKRIEDEKIFFSEKVIELQAYMECSQRFYTDYNDINIKHYKEFKKDVEVLNENFKGFKQSTDEYMETVKKNYKYRKFSVEQIFPFCLGCCITVILFLSLS